MFVFSLIGYLILAFILLMIGAWAFMLLWGAASIASEGVIPTLGYSACLPLFAALGLAGGWGSVKR